jgi:hypothetical protein
MGDVKRFGGATEEQLGAASVYARSLGTELEKIAGILDAFETFEGAADVVSKIAQTWNVQLDPTALLSSQDAADAVEQIRMGFRAAGVDASNFKRSEISLLSELTKLPPEIAKQAFSLKNQGKSLKEIQNSSEAAGKTFSTLETALHDLRKSIEFLVKSGSMPKGGFLDMWIAGIERGIELHPQTRGLFRDIARDLKTTYYDARRVLNAFIADFPGVEQMIKGLREIFNPAVFGNFIRSLNNTLIKFFKDFSQGKATFSQLLDNLKGEFSKFFGSASKGGSQFLAGLELFGEAIALLAGQIIEWIGDAIASGISAIANIIANPEAAIASGKKGLKKIGDTAQSLWAPISDGISKAAKTIKTAFGELVDALLTQFPQLNAIFDLFKTKSVGYKDWQRMGWMGEDNDPFRFSNANWENIVENKQMLGLEMKLREFWHSIVKEFNAFTDSDFFKTFTDILGVLGKAIDNLITVALILTAGSALRGFMGAGLRAAAPMLLAGGAAGVSAMFDGGFSGLIGGLVSKLTSSDDEKDKKGAGGTEVNFNVDGAPPSAGDAALSEGKVVDLYKGEAPKVVNRNLQPAQIKLASSLSLETVSDAMKALTEEVDGGAGAKSSIVQLVGAIRGIDKKIGNQETVDSAKRVSEFFNHVKGLTDALSGMQGLVELRDLEGNVRAFTVADNIQKIEGFLSTLTDGGANSTLGLISTHISELNKYLPEAGITDNVSTFFGKLEEIARKLKSIIGTNIDVSSVQSALISFNSALNAIASFLPQTGDSIKRLNDSLAEIPGGKLSRLKLIGTLAENLKTFTGHFNTLKGSLVAISNSAKAFEGEGSISQFNNQKSLGGISRIIGFLFKGAELPNPANLSAPGISVTSPLSGLTSEMSDLFGAKKGKTDWKGGVTAYSGLSVGLVNLNDFLSKISSAVEGAEGGNGIISNLETISNFFKSIHPNTELGESIATFDTSALGQFMLAILDFPLVSEENFERIKKFGGFAESGKIRSHLDAISELINNANEIAAQLPDIASSASAFNAKAPQIASAMGLGGAYEIGNTTVVINVKVDVSIKSSAIEQIILSDSRSIVKDRLNFAAENPSSPSLPVTGVGDVLVGGLGGN